MSKIKWIKNGTVHEGYVIAPKNTILICKIKQTMPRVYALQEIWFGKGWVCESPHEAKQCCQEWWDEFLKLQKK